MAKTSTASLTEGIQEYHDKLILEQLVPNVVFYEDGDKKPLPKGTGSTIKWMRYLDFDGPELLTEGTAPTAAAVSAENVSTKIFQIGKHTTTTDLIEATHISDVVTDILGIIGEAGARAVDSAVSRCLLWTRTALSARLGIGAGAGYGLSAVGCLSSTQFEAPMIRNGSGGCDILSLSGIHSSATLTVSLLRQAKKHLTGNNAPRFPDGTYHAITHPDAISVLGATSGWIDFTKYTTGANALTGEIGKCQNVRFKLSTNAPVATGAGAKVSAHGGGTVHFTFVYGPHAYGITEISNMRGRRKGADVIIKHSGKQTTSDPLNQNPHTIGYKFTGAAKVLDTKRCLWILTGKGDDSLVAA